MIAEGFVGGGISNSAGKRYVHNLKLVMAIEAAKKSTRSMPHITFTNEDFGDIDRCHNDPMVINIEMPNFLVCKELLNNRSSKVM